MTKKLKHKDFVDAPRPEAMSAEEFQKHLDAIPGPTKKAQRKWERQQEESARVRANLEKIQRAGDKGNKYQVRFNYSDAAGFYEDRAVLPAAAMWNMDEFLFAYIAAGLEALLKGYTDWNWQDASDAEMSTRKKLKKAAKLARNYVDKHESADEKQEDIDGAHECLRILSEVGVARLWD